MANLYCPLSPLYPFPYSLTYPERAGRPKRKRLELKKKKKTDPHQPLSTRGSLLKVMDVRFPGSTTGGFPPPPRVPAPSMPPRGRQVQGPRGLRGEALVLCRGEAAAPGVAEHVVQASGGELGPRGFGEGGVGGGAGGEVRGRRRGEGEAGRRGGGKRCVSAKGLMRADKTEEKLWILTLPDNGGRRGRRLLSFAAVFPAVHSHASPSCSIAQPIRLARSTKIPLISPGAVIGAHYFLDSS